MEFIDFESLQNRQQDIGRQFHASKPFKYVVIDGFLKPIGAVQILEAYPPVETGNWDGTTYINQRNKFQQSVFEQGSLMQRVFDELNSQTFIYWLQQTTGIKEPLVGDNNLFGGGLHQSIKGAFLNIHVDFNRHPKTNYHRRLNVLVYLNKDWKEEYEGYLEFWDFSNGNKTQLAKIAPTFNRCVIFETNELSYHGHPKPLNTPVGVTRKSLATYYYSTQRPLTEISGEHNTVFKNTEGVGGQFKKLISGIKAFFERLG